MPLAEVMKMLNNISHQVYETPESIIKAHFDTDLWELDSIGGIDVAGVEQECTIEQMIDGIKIVGLWGYIDMVNASIHYWKGDNCPKQLFAQFLAHEYMHAAISVLPNTTDESLHEEHLCDAAGLVYGVVEAYDKTGTI